MITDAAIMARLASIEEQNQRMLILLAKLAGTALMQPSSPTPVFSAEAEISPAELARLRSRYGKEVLEEFNAKQRRSR